MEASVVMLPGGDLDVNRACHRGAAGFMLIESLVAMAIFAVGILALVGLQARMTAHMGDAKYRAEAALLVDQLIGTMWADAHGGPWNPSHVPAFVNNLPAYNHYPSVPDSTQPCVLNGAASANPNVVAWLGSATQIGSVLNVLPNAAANRVRISVDGGNAVSITVCWQPPGDTVWRFYQTTAVIRG